MRWLLGTNRPVPQRTEEEVAVEVERNYRWNFAANLLDGAFFWFGYSFASATTIMPLFISKLTSSPLALGLLAVLSQGSWFLPQLFTANVIERLPRKKPVVINLGFFLERIPFWLLVGATFLAVDSPILALFVFLLGYAWHGLGAGTIATAWQDLLARCFPVDRRGRFFGITNFVGIGLGAAGSALSAWLLRTYPFPTNFTYTFGIAAAAVTLSWVFLAMVREPVQAVTAPRQSQRQFWAGLPRILRHDVNFRHFLFARLLMALGGMGTGFVTVAAVSRWGVSDSTVAAYTAALLIGQTFGNLLLGWLADRHGHKLSLEMGALASTSAFAVAWLAPSPAWYYGAFALLGFTSGAIIVSGILVVMEFSDADRRPTYIGLANTGVGVVSMAAPLVGAWLAGVEYTWLFALSTLISFFSLVSLRWWVREPRWADAADVAQHWVGERPTS
jgi:MFS family permease